MQELSKNENIFYSEISELLKQARNTAYKTVNTIMVQTYWQIGKRIVEQEQNGQNRANYGDFLITNLSRYLSDTIGKGFSEANLWNMRQFFLTFPEFSTHCVENLTWTNIRLIMRIDNQAEREYYIKESSEQNWSSRLLERHIKTGYYRRLLSTQQKNDANLIISNTEKYNPADFIIVKYSILKENKQIFASKYKTILPTEDELAAMISREKQKLIEL